jgi:hypothetical protein
VSAESLYSGIGIKRHKYSQSISKPSSCIPAIHTSIDSSAVPEKTSPTFLSTTPDVNSTNPNNYVLVEDQLVPILNYWVYKNGARVLINKTNFVVHEEGSCLFDTFGTVIEKSKCFFLVLGKILNLPACFIVSHFRNLAKNSKIENDYRIRELKVLDKSVDPDFLIDLPWLKCMKSKCFIVLNMTGNSLVPESCAIYYDLKTAKENAND